jgi:excisionase family DNA binding protein
LKRYLSVKEICQILPVCKSLVYRLVRDGQLPSTRFGGKILVAEDELAALLERGQEGEEELPEPPPPVPHRPKARGVPSGGKIDLW